VIVITPSDEDDWAVELRQLARRGVRTFVISLDVESFGGDHSNADIQGLLANIGISSLSVHHGTDLVHTLEVGTDH
jgi:hypothetical protein